MELDHSSLANNQTGITAETMAVKTSAAMFEVMYSSLYERKEEAVLRELAANALDAHIDADIASTPIHITLPTELDPFLIVKDFGKGMSLDTIKSVFFTLFESTKNQTNDLVGGFGIGSKSPYAISESYTVSSVHQGKRTEIIMSMDNGIPKPLLVATEVPTDEPNGTTVTVPVDREHSRTQITLASKKIFQYWDTQPLVDGMSKEAASKDPYFSTPHFTMSSSSWYSNRFEKIFEHVLVGPFRYSVPIDLLERLKTTINKTYSAELSILTKYVIKDTCVLINTKVGDLKLAPSRERIEDTDKNYQILLSYIEEIILAGTKEFKSKSEELIDIILDNVKTPLTELGLPYDKRVEIGDLLDAAASTRSMAKNLLTSNVVNSLGCKKKVEELDKLSAALTQYVNSYYSIYSSVERTGFQTYVDHNFQLKCLKTASYGSITRVELWNSYNAIDEAYNNKTPIYILEDGDTLTDSVKCKINYNLRQNGNISITIGKKTHTLTTNNYYEFVKGDITELKAIAASHFPSDLDIHFLKLEDFKDNLLTPVKSKRIGTTNKVSVTPRNETVVPINTKFYNVYIDKPITVQDLYLDNIYKDYTIIFFKETGYDTFYSLQRVLNAAITDQKVLTLELSTSETRTKRFEKFLENDNVTFFKGFNPQAITKMFLTKKEQVTFTKLCELENNLRSLPQKLLPKAYHSFLEKYSFEEASRRFIVKAKVEYKVPVDTLFQDVKKKAIIDYTYWGIGQAIILAPNEVKQICKTYLDNLIITLKE